MPLGDIYGMSTIVYGIVSTILAFNAVWHAEPPCFRPGPEGAFDEVAVKDPTIVFDQERWHLFYTARNKTGYTLGYACAASVEEFNAEPRHNLDIASRTTGYAAAPQVFYFEPQNLWYLIYQVHNLPGEKGRYTPMYVTTHTLADPDSWSVPQILVQKFEPDKWIDFWVICDESMAYLFYTRNHEAMVYMTTPLERFPHGFSNPVIVENVEVHEAVCVYKIRGVDRYAMLVETNENERRAFRLSTATSLAGPWSVTQPFAAGAMLRFPDGATAWTTMVSHGELLRSGTNQRLEIESLEHTEILIQGTTGYRPEAYQDIEWRLGIIRSFGITSEDVIRPSADRP